MVGAHLAHTTAGARRMGLVLCGACVANVGVLGSQAQRPGDGCYSSAEVRTSRALGSLGRASVASWSISEAVLFCCRGGHLPMVGCASRR